MKRPATPFFQFQNEKRPELKEALRQFGKKVDVAATGRAGDFSSLSEALWASWRENPSEWWDNRSTKHSPTYPDFRHKDTREGLWIDSKSTPQWVREELGGTA